MARLVRPTLGARGSRWLAKRGTSSFGSGGRRDQLQRRGVDSSPGDMSVLHGEEDAHKGAHTGTRDGIVRSSCREREGQGRCSRDGGDDPQGRYDDEIRDWYGTEARRSEEKDEAEGDEARLRSGQHTEEDDDVLGVNGTSSVHE